MAAYNTDNAFVCHHSYNIYGDFSMSKKLLSLYLLLISLDVSSQINQDSFRKSNLMPKDKNPDEIVYTPFGPALKSRIHSIDKGHHLKVQNGTVQIIQTKTNVIVQVIDISSYDNRYKKTNNLVSNGQNNLSSDPMDGWISFANGSVQGDNPRPVTHYSVSYVVPSPPKLKSDQLIYLFSGMQNPDSVGVIVQPVLQWGVSPAGGGRYWAICNWCVTNTEVFFHDSLIKVNSGARLRGVIESTQVTESSYNYVSTFKDYPSELQINNLPLLNELYIALETYSITSCDEFPYDEKIRFTDIEVLTDDLYPKLSWFTDSKNPLCKQTTMIVNGNSYSGQIDIYFHFPSPTDNYNDFFVYPNPVENRLHISPHRPVFNCKIDLYDSYSKLIQTNSCGYLDFEFDIDTQNISAGIYFIRFCYSLTYSQEDLVTHTFKIVKE